MAPQESDAGRDERLVFAPVSRSWRLFHAAIASTLITPSISVLESWFWRGEEDKALRGRNLSALFNPKSLSLLTNHIPACLRRKDPFPLSRPSHVSRKKGS